jgi:hypothetical protein
MVLKTNDLSRVQGEKAKYASGGKHKKGTRVTEERAKAQRAKLDTQAKRVHEEQELYSQEAQAKKTERQDRKSKQRDIEALIEAYLQDHIGGNHSEKTLEWHRTALGLMQLFF